MVQAIKSDCPVSYHLWATELYIRNILAIIKVLCNYKKCVAICELIWLFFLKLHFVLVLDLAGMAAMFVLQHSILVSSTVL